LKGGVAVSEDFADVDVIPLAGLALTIHDQWRIDILLPHRAEISWSPNAEATIVRAGIYLEGDQYRVRTAGNRVDWQTQEITVAAGLVQRMNDYVSVFGEIGSAIAGDYKLRTARASASTARWSRRSTSTSASASTSRPAPAPARRAATSPALPDSPRAPTTGACRPAPRGRARGAPPGDR